MSLIGRKKEQEILLKALESDKAEFIAVYGRRRIGKTFLIRETLGPYLTFSYSGKDQVSKAMQIKSFVLSMKEQGLSSPDKPKDWFHAFSLLKTLITQSEGEGKKVIFLDEVAWMDNQKSEFLPALEGFWNEWASGRKDIVLIICASATSWILRKVFHNRGGLHNRITLRIHLEQFTLKECEEYSNERNLGYSRSAILSLYMILGGVAYYWSLLDKSLSVSQNIDYLFFSGFDAPLRNEFKELFRSLFSSPEGYIKIIEALGKKKSGLSRKEIAEECGIANNTKLGEMMEELELCGIIRRYIPFGKEKNGMIHQLMDCLTLFHFSFLSKPQASDDWSYLKSSSQYRTWCELSFERVLMLHTNEIKRVLGISGIRSESQCWRSSMSSNEEGEKGAQIDLLLDRADNLIDIIEAKWSDSGEPYTMTQKDEESLLNKRNALRRETNTRKSIHLVMATLSGVKKNVHSECIASVITLDDIFA